MTSTYIIRPDVMNVLCGDPLPVRKASTEAQAQLATPKKSFWSKVKSFFKKTWGYFAGAVAVLTPAVNAAARYRAACNVSNTKKLKGD